MNLERLQAILKNLKFHDWKFKSALYADVLWLWVEFKDDSGEKWSSRSWRISNAATTSEVVQTALKCVLTALEHEARERFTYRGRAIFGPHFDVESLVGLVDSKVEDRRIG